MTSQLKAALILILALVTPILSGAQPEKPLRLGLLVFGPAPLYSHLESALLAGLRERGYIEGKNLVFERRYADGLFPARVRELARELASLNLDAIVSTCDPTTSMVKQATANTPIVMVGVVDPVGQGFATALAQPGTNITGTSSQYEDLIPKMLELFVRQCPGRN